MAQGRQEDQWKHTSHLLAELMNGPRRRKDKRPWIGSQLDPFTAKQQSPDKIRVSPKEFVGNLLKAWF